MPDLTKEHLRYLRQMEAIGRLSGPIAHDINNLLSGILGYSELLLSEPSIEPLKPHVREISNAARRIASLARILLIFSRKYISHPEELNLNNAIVEIENLIPYVVGPTIQFETVKDTGLWRVRADSSKIKQALITVAIDIREIMPDGGHFTLLTRNCRDPQKGNRTGSNESERYVQITVMATGKLASDQVLSCLPRPESFNKDSGEGGSEEISNTFEIIKAFDGHVATDCRPGKEMRIDINLPAAVPHSTD